MRYIFAMWVIIVLVFLLFFSLFGMIESGVTGFVLAGLSGYGLYKILRIMYKGYKAGNSKEKRPSGYGGSHSPSDPLEFIVFYDLDYDVDPDNKEDY